METKCYLCKRTITNAQGERLLGANFDSDLPVPEPTPDTTWAVCEDCYPDALALKALDQEEFRAYTLTMESSSLYFTLDELSDENPKDQRLYRITQKAAERFMRRGNTYEKSDFIARQKVIGRRVLARRNLVPIEDSDA